MTSTYCLTRYALSKGITAVEVSHGGSGPTHFYEGVSGTPYVSHLGNLYRVGTDAHPSMAAAVADAEARRAKKLKALHRQIIALEKETFP